MRAARGGGACWVLWVSALVALGCCHGTASAAELTGSLRGTLDIVEGQFPRISRLDLTLGVRGEFSHTSVRATATNDGWFSYLGFSDVRQIGELTSQTLIVFDPEAVAFKYFSNLLRFPFSSVRVANYLYVPRQTDQIYDQITIDGVAGPARLRAVTRVGLCPTEFRTFTFQAAWTWADCLLDLTALVTLACDTGFERLRLTAIRREVPYLSFGSLTTDFAITIDYEPEGKSLAPELRMRIAQTSFCLTPMLELELGTPLSIAGLTVYGIKLECGLDEGVEFYAATSMLASKNQQLVGNPAYFEVYRLTVQRPVCCDQDLRITAAVYFEEGSAWLFDWGMLAASVDLPFGSHVRGSVSTEFPSNGKWSLQCTWEWRF